MRASLLSMGPFHIYGVASVLVLIKTLDGVICFDMYMSIMISLLMGAYRRVVIYLPRRFNRSARYLDLHIIFSAVVLMYATYVHVRLPSDHVRHRRGMGSGDSDCAARDRTRCRGGARSARPQGVGAGAGRHQTLRNRSSSSTMRPSCAAVSIASPIRSATGAVSRL